MYFETKYVNNFCFGFVEVVDEVGSDLSDDDNKRRMVIIDSPTIVELGCERRWMSDSRVG